MILTNLDQLLDAAKRCDNQSAIIAIMDYHDDVKFTGTNTEWYIHMMLMDNSESDIFLDSEE